MTTPEVVLGFISCLIGLVMILLIIAEIVLLIGLLGRFGLLLGFGVWVMFNLSAWGLITLVVYFIRPEIFV